MYYALIVHDVAVAAVLEPGSTISFPNERFETRNDWKTFERAEQIAKQLTEKTGTLFIATDAGPNCSPRYDVIDAPVVGLEVSRYFNGDSYPEGEIVRISPSLRRIETSTGAAFYRRRKSGSWINAGTWALIAGHHNDRNPSF